MVFSLEHSRSPIEELTIRWTTKFDSWDNKVYVPNGSNANNNTAPKDGVNAGRGV